MSTLIAPFAKLVPGHSNSFVLHGLQHTRNRCRGPTKRPSTSDVVYLLERQHSQQYAPSSHGEQYQQKFEMASGVFSQATLLPSDPSDPSEPPSEPPRVAAVSSPQRQCRCNSAAHGRRPRPPARRTSRRHSRRSRSRSQREQLARGSARVWCTNTQTVVRTTCCPVPPPENSRASWSQLFCSAVFRAAVSPSPPRRPSPAPD